MNLVSVLVIPLITIFMSGVVASVVTYKLNSRLQHRDFMRGKAEQLFSSFHEYCNNLRGHFLIHIPLLSGTISQNQSTGLAQENLSKSDSAHFRDVEMLVGIYFHELQAELNRLK